MKSKQRRSLLRHCCGLVTRNFKLKLLALALAILIYQLIAPEALPESEDKAPPVLQQVFLPQSSQSDHPSQPKADAPSANTDTANTNTTNNVNN